MNNKTKNKVFFEDIEYTIRLDVMYKGKQYKSIDDAEKFTRTKRVSFENKELEMNGGNKTSAHIAAEQTIEDLKKSLRNRNIPFESIEKVGVTTVGSEPTEQYKKRMLQAKQ